jgi:hypothetical protein
VIARWPTAALERIAAIPLIEAELIPRSRRATVMSAVTAGIAALIIWSTYVGGTSRGMDHVIAYGIEIDLTPISVVLTESVYGINLGYVALSSVYSAMNTTMRRGITTPDVDALLRNAGDRQLINEAITRASSLSVNDMHYGYFSDRWLMSMMYQDLGTVDYIKLSFRLFGNRIEALYYTFFVILAVSAVLFLATFPNSITAQVVLLSALFAFLLELHTPIFTPDMPSLTTVRHSSVFAMIPVWHFALLTLERRKLSWLLLVLAAGQVAILVFAITMRSTAMWAVVFLGGLAVVCGSSRWLAGSPEGRTFTAWLVQVVSWPVIALIVALAVQGQVTKMNLHPVYFTDDVLPHHPLWHSAYLGFRYSPELYGFPVPPEMIGADLLAFNAAQDYLRSVHLLRGERNVDYAAGYVGLWNAGTPKWRLHDEIMRRIVLQIVREHPWKTIYLLAWKKPVAIWNVALDLVRRSARPLKPLTVAGGVIAGLLWIVFGGRRELLVAARLVLVGGGAVAASILPCVWAYPVSWTVTDGLLLAFATVVVAIGVLVAAAYFAARGAYVSISGRQLRSVDVH